jgi:hypothetical protein
MNFGEIIFRGGDRPFPTTFLEVARAITSTFLR